MTTPAPSPLTCPTCGAAFADSAALLDHCPCLGSDEQLGDALADAMSEFQPGDVVDGDALLRRILGH